MSEYEIIQLLETSFWKVLIPLIVFVILIIIFIVSLIRKRESFKIVKIMFIILLLSISIVFLEKTIAIGTAIKNKGWLLEDDVITGYTSRHIPKSNAAPIRVIYFEKYQSYRDPPSGIGGVGDPVELLIVPGYLGTDHIITINGLEKSEE